MNSRNIKKKKEIRSDTKEFDILKFSIKTYNHDLETVRLLYLDKGL